MDDLLSSSPLTPREEVEWKTFPFESSPPAEENPPPPPLEDSQRPTDSFIRDHTKTFCAFLTVWWTQKNTKQLQFNMKDLVERLALFPQWNTLLEEFFAIHHVRATRNLFFGRVLQALIALKPQCFAPLVLKKADANDGRYGYVIMRPQKPQKRKEVAPPPAAPPMKQARVVVIPKQAHVANHRSYDYIVQHLIVTWGTLIQKYFESPNRPWMITHSQMKRYLHHWFGLQGHEPGSYREAALLRQLKELGCESVQWEGWTALWKEEEQILIWCPQNDPQEDARRLVRWWARYLSPFVQAMEIGDTLSLSKQLDFPVLLCRPGVPFTYKQMEVERHKISPELMQVLYERGFECQEKQVSVDEFVLTLVKRIEPSKVDVDAPSLLPIWVARPPKEATTNVVAAAPPTTPCHQHEAYMSIATHMRSSAYTAYSAATTFHSLMERLHTCAQPHVPEA